MKAIPVPQTEVPDIHIDQQIEHIQPGLYQPTNMNLEDHKHDLELAESKSARARYLDIQGYLTIVGGICLHLVLGGFYLWGGISPYVVAYLRQFDKSVTPQLMGLVFPLMALAQNSVLSFGVKLAQKIGFKITIFMCGLTISLAYLIISFLESFLGLVLIYCFMIGVPSGLVYVLPILCGWRYFPKYKGRVSGPIISGYGFGSFIFNFVCQGYVNPNNQSPDQFDPETGEKFFSEDVYSKVPNMFRILSGSYFVLVIIATVLIKYPRDINYEQLAVQDQNLNSLKPPLEIVNECQTLKQGIASRPFYFLMPMSFFLIMFGMLMANIYKVYGFEIGLDDRTLTTIGAISGAVNGCSRTAWAFLMDKFSFKFVIIIITFLNLLTSSLLGDATKTTGYLILISLIMACEGGILATFPAVTSKMFGNKVGPIMYGLIFLSMGISTVIAYLLYRFLVDSITFSGLFWIIFFMNVFALILGFFFQETYLWKK